MASGIDSLNNLTTDDEELIQKQIREYFEEMELPEEEIEKRIGFATDIEKDFRNLFLLMLGADMLGNDLQKNAQTYADYAYNRMQDAMVEYGYSQESGYEALGYIEQYAKQRCKEIVDTTILHKADAFYLSTAHSIAISEDETNAIANYDMEQQAIAQGYTMKTWVTMRDKKVRHTHELCDGKTINIFKAFDVGNYQMMFPCDHSLGASMKEIANCRCVVEYSGKDNSLKDDSKKQLNNEIKQVKIESNNQILKFNLQFFAENLENQSSQSLSKGMKNLRKRIEEHKRKIANPKDYMDNWEKACDQEKIGTVKAWEKEIKKYQKQIDDRVNELKRRGDYNE